MSLWAFKIGKWRPVYSLGLFYLRYSPFKLFKKILLDGVTGYTPRDIRFTNKDGIIFHLDIAERVQKGIFCFHYYGPEDVAAFRKFIKPGCVVFDIGANVGQYALLASRLVADTGRVYAFEPNQAIFLRLKENVELNAAGNVFLVPKAVAAESKTMRFYPPSEETCQDIGSLLPAQGTSSNTEVEVEAVSLDDFCDMNGIERVDFLKVDAEGYDLEVLKGAVRMMARNPNLVVMAEIVESLLKQVQTTPADFYDFMEKRGFKPYVVTKTGRLRPLRGEKPASLLNVFFIPGRRA